MPVQLADETRDLLVRASELIDQQSAEAGSVMTHGMRKSRKEFTGLLKSILSTTNPTPEQVTERNSRLTRIIDQITTSPQEGPQGPYVEDYIRSWQTSLMSASGVLVGITLAVLNILPSNLVWYVSFVISLVVFLAAVAFGVSAWFALKALGTVVLAVHSRRDAYDPSIAPATKAKRAFLVGLGLVVTAILILALTTIPNLHATV